MGVTAGGVMHARRRPGSWVGLSLLGIGLATLAVAAAQVLSRDGTTRTVAILVLVAGSAWFLCTQHTKLALVLLMLYLGLLDGYLKLATGSSGVTLVRDALLYAIVLGLLVRAQVEGRHLSLPPLSGWVIAYVAFVLVQIPNPNGGTLVHSLAGVRPHLEFVPLFFLGYTYVRDVRALRRFIVLLLLLAAANGIVSFIQFHLTPQQLASWGRGYAEFVNGTGNVSGRTFLSVTGVVRVRPLGLGSDSGDGGLFAVLALGGILAFASFIVSVRYRIFALLCGACAVAGIVTSEGRADVVAGVVTVIAYGILAASGPRRLATLAGLAVAIALSYFVVVSIVAGAGGGSAFRYQGLDASKILATTTGPHGRQGQLAAIGFNLAHYPLGAGLGSAGPASSTAGGGALDQGVNAESEFSFLVVEAGIPGLITIVCFSLVLLGSGMIRCRREPDHVARTLLAALICPLAGIITVFYVEPITVTVPAGPFLWFVGGVLAYWLVTLPRKRAEAEQGLGVRPSLSRPVG